ncbi:DUF2127 domain-containing protein [Actinoallomurus purpureus]|uniref:DUF2127 domain-containing protein n=1 Tax=Actinoallomurus purpureus TaxID=478114 RepID=UPI002093181E|nr:DUF2127 domain-containing protein [Actinoallomurus purpureus]MCO6008790.1 DUF2127 domain-containing protein [Actinoallomurus purpureus]
MDWSLLKCARAGHVTYAPDEPALQDRLHVATPAGEAWRCLRCGAYVHGEPHDRGPADRAPLIMRGRELRSELIMRFFAVERVIRGLVIIAAAYGVWRFSANRGSIQRAFEKDVPLLKPFARQVGWDLDHSRIVESIRHVFTLKSETLTWFAVGLLAYALIEIVEAVGLWLGKRWGEYFAVVATSFGLPLEIYELTERITAVRVGALVINLGLVLYLLISKRLFGIRGGKEAFEAHRRGASLIEVEQAAAAPHAETAG